MNYRFNLDEWLPRFPLQERNGHYDGQIITSPWHLCQNELLRRELRDAYDWGPPVPMDMFVMAKGEPPDRHVTKIGGLPYRPADADWPTTDDGKPMVFVGQFNFHDSKDLTGELPGDLLLVFADEPSGPLEFYVEWNDIGLRDLIESKDMPLPPPPIDPLLRMVPPEIREAALAQYPKLAMPPATTNEFHPCYGQIVRTVSYPEAALRDESLKYPLCNGKEVHSDYFLTCYQATQIGEAPFFIQEGDRDDLPGRPLCTISSVQPRNGFAPAPAGLTPPPEQIRRADDYLMIGDVGCIYISIDEAGEVHAHWSCY